MAGRDADQTLEQKTSDEATHAHAGGVATKGRRSRKRAGGFSPRRIAAVAAAAACALALVGGGAAWAAANAQASDPADPDGYERAAAEGSGDGTSQNPLEWLASLLSGDAQPVTSTDAPNATSSLSAEAESAPALEQRNVMLGTAGLNSPEATDDGTDGALQKHRYLPQDYLWLGTYNEQPILWRVLDAQSTNNGSDGVFLLSEYAIENKPFTTNGQKDWLKSDARVWANGTGENQLLGDFTQTELASIPATDKVEAVVAGDGGNNSNFLGTTFDGSTLDGDQAFFISAFEIYDDVANYDTPTQGKSRWSKS